jgi:hypothetical protein
MPGSGAVEREVTPVKADFKTEFVDQETGIEGPPCHSQTPGYLQDLGLANPNIPGEYLSNTTSPLPQ